MRSFAARIEKTRLALLVLGVLAALYYAVVYRGFARSATALDADLDAMWAELSRDPLDADIRLKDAQSTDVALSAMQDAILGRTRLNPVFQAGLQEPFQLARFEIERERLNDELVFIAGGRKLEIPEIPFESLPEYTEEMEDPRRLWGMLGLSYHAISSAMDSGVASIESLGGFEARALRSGDGDGELDEIVFEMTLTGAMSRIAVFLKTLPMDGQEMERHGRESSEAAKPALFIDGLMLRKRPGANPDDVRLDVRLGGYIRRNVE